MTDPALQNLALDSVDTRTEIHRLIERLSPSDRIRFLRWACTRAPLTSRCSTVPGVSAKTRQLAQLAPHDSSADRRLSLVVYFDLWMLSIQYHFDLESALNKLVEMVLRRGITRGRGRSVGPRVSSAAGWP